MTWIVDFLFFLSGFSLMYWLSVSHFEKFHKILASIEAKHQVIYTSIVELRKKIGP